MILLFALIILLLFMIQLLLGFLAWSVKNKRANKFAYPIGEQIEPADLVEKYFYEEKYKFELKATAEIETPAFAEKNLLLVNRNSLNKKDLFNNFYLIYQAELVSERYDTFRIYNNIQAVAFLVQFLCLLAGIAINGVVGQAVLILGTFIFICSLIFAIWAAKLQSTALRDARKIALAVLKLDDVEKARLNALIEDIKYEILEYPWEVSWRLWVFFTP